MRAKTVDFERGQHPYKALDIGKKHVITLTNGYEFEGPYSTKDEAEKLAKDINKSMENIYKEAEEEGYGESHAMDLRDDIIELYEEDLLKLGYWYTED